MAFSLPLRRACSGMAWLGCMGAKPEQWNPRGRLVSLSERSISSWRETPKMSSRGAPLTCFAYRYGRYDRRSREVVRRHFDCAC